MEPAPAFHTLLEEWEWRRERLGRSPGRAAECADEQIRVLDYLIRRYRDAPEAQTLPPPRPRADCWFDRRAIVVHHHVWEGKVGGIKSAKEAEARVSAILQRMSSHAARATSDTGAAWALDVDVDDGYDPLSWHPITAYVHSGRPPRDRVIAKAIAKDPQIPQSVARYLYERIVSSQEDDVQAAEFLAQGRSRAAFNYAAYAWRDLVASDRADQAWEALDRFLVSPEPRETVLPRVRASLADDNAQVRLATLRLLESIGTLEDIGLLSDLLALLPAADEHPEERAALVQAMQRIGETTS